MATALEQLRYIDEQLAAAALPHDQAELVRVHRLTGLQLRNQRLQELGHPPEAGTTECVEWEKCKKELESEVDMSLAETRLSVEGLEESWEKWLHIEKLKAVREQLLQQTAAEGILIDGKTEQQPDAVSAISVSASPAQLHDAAAWDTLQIAPLASPGGWEAQQQQNQQLQQQLQEHMQHTHDGGQAAGLAENQQIQQDPQQLHMQQQWQAMGHPQDVQGQVMTQPAQPQTAPNPEGVPMKHCRRCNTHKPITSFYKSKANADGYDGRCKTCDAVQCAQRRKRKERIETPTVEWKSCKRCALHKPASDFYRNKTNADGLYNNCKTCFTQDAQSRRDRLPPLEERTATAKTCRRCKDTKPAAEFYKNKHMSDGLYTHCKACYTDAANQRSAGRSPAETKRCRRCGNTKEAIDFYASKMTADGLQSYCKACYAVASAARRCRTSQDPGMRVPKDLDDYAVQQQVLREHLMQGQMVDPMQQQVMGVPQMQAGMDPSMQMQQMGYDPSVMQASLADHHALGHHGMEQVGHHGMDHAGLEHHHAAMEQHHAMQHPQHHLDHQAMQHPHHHLDPTGHPDYQNHTGLEHHSLDHEQHDQLHDHQAYSHAQAATLTHQHSVM